MCIHLPDAGASGPKRGSMEPHPVEPRAKRPRDAAGGAEAAAPKGPTAASPPRFALVSCFDKRDELVEVDVRLLEQFDCRLYAVIKHNAPAVDHAGRLFWRCGMTRAMLQTFVRSLEHGELSLSKNVSVAEAMTTFEYENVPVGVPADRKAEVAGLRQAPPGAAFAKRAERVSEDVARTSELVAHALARWPRLETCLDAALSGFPVSCTCTATRAWVRFTRKPQLHLDKGDSSVALARSWPAWIETTLRAFGQLHGRLVRDKVVGERDRHAEAFNALYGAVQSDQLAWLMATPFDWPRHSMDRTARKESAKGELFANEQREAVLAASSARGQEPPEALQYARACMSLAESLLFEAPNVATMYAGQCSDDQGKSPERVQLQRSLAQRGIKVVRWSEDDKTPPRPLIFPPAWAEGPSSGSVHCAALLEFAGR